MESGFSVAPPAGTPVAVACYVATYGSDETGTGEINKPFATVAKAGTVIGAGGTIYVRGGSYDQYIADIKTPCTIKSYPDETAIFAPTTGSIVIHVNGADEHDMVFENMTLDGTNVTANCAKVDVNAYNVTFRNCEMFGSPYSGAICSNGGYSMTLEGCTIHDVGTTGNDHGVYLSATTGNVVQGCTIYNSPGYGVQLEHQNDSAVNVIDGNYIHSVAASAIVAYYGIVTVQNNVCYDEIKMGSTIIQGNIYHNTVIHDPENPTVTTGYRITAMTENEALLDIANNLVIGSNIGVSVKGSTHAPSAYASIRNNLINADTVDVHPDPDCNLNYDVADTITATFTPYSTDGAAQIVPQAGNPAIGAGTTDTDVAVDYGGNTRNSPPTIGAWE